MQTSGTSYYCCRYRQSRLVWRKDAVPFQLPVIMYRRAEQAVCVPLASYWCLLDDDTQVKAVLHTALSESDAPLAVGDLRQGGGTGRSVGSVLRVRSVAPTLRR